MERLILKKLLDWKNSPYRKPLILKGVRQVGKTWILKEFGKCYYENTAYFNFDENEEYKQFFETTKDVDRILQNLILASGQKIVPEKTLIIFDEFANNLSPDTVSGHGTGDERKDNIKRLLNFFPVLGEDEEGTMEELDAAADENGEVEIPNEVVIGKTQDLFGAKVYEQFAQDVQSQVSNHSILKIEDLITNTIRI